MGFIKAFAGSLGGALGEQWQDFLCQCQMYQERQEFLEQ